MKRMFRVNVAVDISLDEALVASVLDPKWRAQFYDLRTPEDVAGHLAFNLLQGRLMRHLDGFADQPEDAAVIGDIETVESVEIRKGARHT
jgi:hypothetical protein